MLWGSKQFSKLRQTFAISHRPLYKAKAGLIYGVVKAVTPGSTCTVCFQMKSNNRITPAILAIAAVNPMFCALLLLTLFRNTND